MLLNCKNEITILYSGGFRNTYFETKKSGRNDEQNKLNKGRIKRVYVGYKFHDYAMYSHPARTSWINKGSFLKFLAGHGGQPHLVRLAHLVHLAGLRTSHITSAIF